ncbi:S-adenosyl-L-methionine-dependent methyltransferase [Lasiosphaeris hirsuta]|uniref:S-adenosyl-L-methionine-dependent methyltransferase n=1 Tax=Lasiosphaeris hirsuta TaxID=260670 RepID=A0AA40EBN2_9PEZI|nr:S-adenosyl-L-methionine-dependent methyltransferase [Lasiosphaeris hirsuta]
MATEPAATPATLSTEAVFDLVGPAYEDAFAGLPTQAASIRWILSQLSAAGVARAKTVDIGCGTGKPVCSELAAAGHDVLGIDISGAMVDAARARVPAARFDKVDIRDFRPGAATYDVATAYFSLIAGVTQDEIRAVLAQVFGFLKPGGLFVWSTVPLDAERADIRWMGKPVTVSSLAPEPAVAAVRAAGFVIEHEAVTTFTPKGAEAGICQPEDVWEETHLFVYARKPVL